MFLLLQNVPFQLIFLLHIIHGNYVVLIFVSIVNSIPQRVLVD